MKLAIFIKWLKDVRLSCKSHMCAKCKIANLKHVCCPRSFHDNKPILFLYLFSSVDKSHIVFHNIFQSYQYDVMRNA